MKLLEFLQDDNDGFSATRLAFLLWALGLLTIWVINSVKTGTLQPIPESVITMMGILMGGKVVQKFGETPASPAGQPAGASPAGNAPPLPLAQLTPQGQPV